MLLIVALAMVWNVMGGGVSLVTDRK